MKQQMSTYRAACPLCGAQPGEECVGVYENVGLPMSVPHDARIDAFYAERNRKAELYPELVTALQRLMANRQPVPADIAYAEGVLAKAEGVGGLCNVVPNPGPARPHR